MTHAAHVPLAQPDISEADIEAVCNVLRTPRLSLGPALTDFEEAFAKYIGVEHAIAVSSGTAALHLCVRAAGLGEGDEVITTPFSFVASSNCILFEKATPVFVDIDPKTYCIDPVQVEAAITPKTKAIVAVDVFGRVCDWSALQSLASEHNLILIEDSCEALGTKQHGIMAGAFGDFGTFAFYPNKQMTTGEGGMVVTNDSAAADVIRSMRNQGRDSKDGFLEHSRLGYNYRISDINCALGTSQLSRIEEFIESRQKVFLEYREALSSLEGMLSFPYEQPDVRTSWFVYVAELASSYTRTHRDAILDALRADHIGCNTYFPSIHLQPFYKEMMHSKAGDFPVTEGVSERTIALPFYSSLESSQIQRVVEVLKGAVESLS